MIFGALDCGQVVILWRLIVKVVLDWRLLAVPINARQCACPRAPMGHPWPGPAAVLPLVARGQTHRRALASPRGKFTAGLQP